MKTLFFDIETAIKFRLDKLLETLSQLHNRLGQVREAGDVCFQENGDDSCASTQFLQLQKNQLIDLQEHFERSCNMLPVFGFNSANFDINLIKSCLLPILINRRDIEPVVIEKANQYISFEFGDIQLLDIMNFLGGATSLDSFLEAHKTSESKRFFPYEWLNHPDKIQNTELLPYDAFYSKLRDFNPLEAE